MIKLPYGGRGAEFDACDLVRHITNTGRDYIIQGQQHCALVNHTKRQSLDYWLRANFASNSDTAQAVHQVMVDLLTTGLFAFERLPCPETGYRSNALRLVGSPSAE
jgi:hypothetical protein